jgi:hypothetical protein
MVTTAFPGCSDRVGRRAAAARTTGIRTRLRQVRTRLRVWRHRNCLDAELAGGGDDASAERTLRAAQLVDPATCRQLARSLRGLVQAAERPGRALGTAAPVCRESVLTWRGGLLGLADRLDRPDPPNACGVARLVTLLSDGGSALYCSMPQRSLGEMIFWIADGLQPCPPHDWRCPVVMKLDPEHVAWTCGRCGAIALTRDPGVRPV